MQKFAFAKIFVYFTDIFTCIFMEPRSTQGRKRFLEVISESFRNHKEDLPAGDPPGLKQVQDDEITGMTN